MLFMIIERFKDNDMVPIYRQVRDGGRMLPEGLEYVDSWVEPNFARCFQLMHCTDLRLFRSLGEERLPFEAGQEFAGRHFARLLLKAEPRR